MELGCPVSFHSGRDPEAPFEIIRLFQEAGGDVSKVVMSHLESKFDDFLIFISIVYKLLKLHVPMSMIF
jgi:predicted metal-dependent phosphotriesterase family hydrolase